MLLDSQDWTWQPWGRHRKGNYRILSWSGEHSYIFCSKLPIQKKVAGFLIRPSDWARQGNNRRQLRVAPERKTRLFLKLRLPHRLTAATLLGKNEKKAHMAALLLSRKQVLWLMWCGGREYDKKITRLSLPPSQSNNLLPPLWINIQDTMCTRMRKLQKQCHWG